MKKLLAVAVLSFFSVKCMAGKHSPTISITNNTDVTVDVSDKDNHAISVEPGRSESLGITVHENHGTLIPSLIMPYVTTITVKDDEGSNSIEVNENTKSVIIDEGLKLSKE